MNFKEGVIIPIDKPYGITSFKALAHVRYLCSKAQGGRVKIGHAGTLDPLATGVLILATGKMTKQIETLQTHTKEYVATMQLGATTPSYDMEHEENEIFPTEHITRELIETALQQFIGESTKAVGGMASQAVKQINQGVSQLKDKIDGKTGQEQETPAADAAAEPATAETQDSEARETHAQNDAPTDK